MKESILNLPKIRKVVSKKHKEFIEKVGDIPSKISADFTYSLERLVSKTASILKIFKSEGIIDKIISCEDSFYRGFNISKNGMAKSVYIWTDGNSVILRESNLIIQYGSFSSIVQLIKIGDLDEYDFEEFALEILKFIHGSIYERKDSIDSKIFKI